MQSFSESLNSQYKIDRVLWNHQGARVYIQHPNSLKHGWTVNLEHYSGLLDVEFTRYVDKLEKNSYLPTGVSSSSEALTLYATIGTIVIDYVKQFGFVKQITFESSVGAMNAVYDMLAKRLAKRLDWRYVRHSESRWSVRNDQ